MLPMAIELARGQGFEPQFSDPESDVLPLDDPRMLFMPR
jgi:hypothetical protein